MDVLIRQARPNDAAELYELNLLFNGPKGCNPDGIRASLGEESSELVAVAQWEGALVGFVCGQIFRSMCYREAYGEITELYVLEEFRKQGVGRRLIICMEELFRIRDVRHFQLFTGADNVTARRFYEGLGYEKSEEVMYRKNG